MNQITFNNVSNFTVKDLVWEVVGNGVCEVLGKIAYNSRHGKFAFYDTNPIHSLGINTLTEITAFVKEKNELL